MGAIADSQGLPTYGVATSPDFTGPLAATKDALAPLLNLTFADAAERDATIAPPVDGMRAYLQNEQAWTEYRGGAWRYPERPRRRTWKFSRATNDNFASGTFGSLVGGTIVAAEAGDWWISATASVASDVAGAGNLRVLAGGANLSSDLPADLAVADSRTPVSFASPYEHAGGDLAIEILYYVSAGTATAYAGAVVAAAFLGPRT